MGVNNISSPHFHQIKFDYISGDEGLPSKN